MSDGPANDELTEHRGTDSPRKVLLVDDEETYINALAERLRTRGFDVEIATSGEEAVKKVDASHFDTVVLDYAMPGMDGIETLKAIQERRSGLSFMLLSGRATIKAAVEATRLGAVEILEKPTDIRTLEEKLLERSV